jgi:hypothetical protein
MPIIATFERGGISPEAVEGLRGTLAVPVSRREGRPLGGGKALPRVRGDRLPENTRYRDDGCNIHPQCLSCPLPRCRYEDRGGLRGMINEHRDRGIIEARTKGIGAEEVARQFNVSRRTVFRVMELAAQTAYRQRPEARPSRRRSQRVRVPVFLRRVTREEEEARCA